MPRTAIQQPGSTLGEVAPDPVDSAKAAGLRYVTDAQPGIRRQRHGNSFVYVNADGQEVTDPDERVRIKALGIPPAWTDVWICPDPRGHLQATGRDARRRKQYRYHARWRQARDESKYERLLAFGQALPIIRKRVEQDLGQPGLPRTKVLAAIVQLLEATAIRVGNDEYARDNDSFGLTTLQDRHARISGGDVRFKFRGKSAKDHLITLHDRRLAKIVKQCRDIPGQRLFQYAENGDYHSVYSEDVNAYLRDIGGQDFSAKDFRTWSGTVFAAQALRQLGPFASKADAKKKVLNAIDCVAERLGNTRAVCRKCYIHPDVIDAYMEGALEALPDTPEAPSQLPPDESAVLALLGRRLERAA
jgi:DNA topoisomerase I